MAPQKPIEAKNQISFDFERPRPIVHLLPPKELFDSCDEALLRQFGNEDSRLEKKPSGVHPKQLGEYFSMWANTQPNGGFIVVGIRKDKVFEGCSKLSAGQLNRIEQTADTFCPDAVYKIKKVQIKSDEDRKDDYVIVFLVEYNRNRVVATTNGKVFIRIGSSKIEVKGEALRHLRSEKGEIRFESETCNINYPQDIDLKSIDIFVEKVRNIRRWDERHSKEHILSLMHLGDLSGDTFSPNIAMALLFSKDPRLIIPGCRIRFLRFSGEIEGSGSTWDSIKDEIIDGTIPFQIQGMDQILKSQLRNNIKQRKVWVDSDVIDILGAQLAHSLSENEKRCINFCAENGEISVSDAQRLTKMTWPAASKMLKRLTEREILFHEHKEGTKRDPTARFKLRISTSNQK